MKNFGAILFLLASAGSFVTSMPAYRSDRRAISANSVNIAARALELDNFPLTDSNSDPKGFEFHGRYYSGLSSHSQEWKLLRNCQREKVPCSTPKTRKPGIALGVKRDRCLGVRSGEEARQAMVEGKRRT
ncbi:hypothetical protein K445DRAFT_16733 [Daldinia sp. EC12]|nr:hypothetical protein K445DRAFT_16733 [Daldinia sp. EC12]